MDEVFYRKQAELLAPAVAQSDVVITTAAVPGSKAPVLVTAVMVKSMRPGSIVIDLAAKPDQDGGNCELTRPDQTVQSGGATIFGPTNLPSTVPQTASQLYAKNMATFLLHLVKDGKLVLDMSDEITAQTLLTENGQIVQPRVRQQFSLEPMVTPQSPAPAGAAAAT